MSMPIDQLSKLLLQIQTQGPGQGSGAALPIAATGMGQQVSFGGNDPGAALSQAMVQQKQLDRSQGMNQALQGQFLQPLQGQMVGNHYVGPGIGGAIGQVLGAYMTGKSAKRLDQREGELAGTLGNARASFAQEAMGSPNGYLQLLSSSDPAMQQLGAAMMQSQVKGGITAKDLLPYADPRAIPSLVQSGTAGFQAKPKEMKEVGGVLYDPESLTVAQLQGAAPARVEFQGDLYEQNPTTGQWKKLDNAPKVSVTSAPIINVGGKGNQAYAEGLGKADADRYKDAREAASTAVTKLNTVEEMRNILASGKVFEGPLADIRLKAEGLGAQVGMGDREAVARSRQFDSAVNSMLGELIAGAAGKSMTDPDREVIKSQGATLADTAEGKRKVLEIMERTQKRILEAANREIEAANKFKAEQGMPPTELYSLPQQPPFPGTPAPTPSGATMTLDEYLKKNSGGR